IYLLHVRQGPVNNLCFFIQNSTQSVANFLMCKAFITVLQRNLELNPSDIKAYPGSGKLGPVGKKTGNTAEQFMMTLSCRYTCYFLYDPRRENK
ncbi:MAG: hypothetical protein ACK55Z_00455, partial [bacterium]